MGQKIINKIGYWSALLTAAAVAIFALMLILGLWKIPTAMLSFGVCFLLAPCYVAMTAAIHQQTPGDKKIWSSLGVLFAVIYAVLILIVYYTQLAVVRTNSLQIPAETLKLFAFTPGSFLFALDMLGYTFLCLSTLFTFPVFSRDSRLSRLIRRVMFIHGLFFIPTIIFPLLSFPQETGALESANLFGSLSLILWCVVFLPIPILVAGYFRKVPEIK